MESITKPPRLYICRVCPSYRSSTKIPLFFFPARRVPPHTPRILPTLFLLLFFFNCPYITFLFFQLCLLLLFFSEYVPATLPFPFFPSFFLGGSFPRPTCSTTSLEVQLRVRRQLQELAAPRAPKVNRLHLDGVVYRPLGRLE